MYYELREKRGPVSLIKIITIRSGLGGAGELIRRIGLGGVIVLGCNNNRQMIAAMGITQCLP